jgi:putative oxidoreductase
VTAFFATVFNIKEFTMNSTEHVLEKSWRLLAKRRIEEAVHLLNGQEWIVQLLIRLFVGYFFMETGWAKLHNLDGFARRFAGWGIPWPHFNAALSAYTEFIGGLLTIFGIGTRLVSIPMIINMLVAILKVNLMSVNTLDDFVELDEPLYALTYLWLLISGPGWVSVDYLMSRVFRFNGQAANASSVSSKEGAVLKHDAITGSSEFV